MKREFSSPDPTDDIAGRIAALSPKKQELLRQKLTKKVVDGHTLVARSLKGLGVTHVYSRVYPK